MNEKEKRFLDLFDGGQNLPALPSIYNDAILLIDNPRTTTDKLAKLILQDQSIVSQVIRLSNSPLFSARQEITSLVSAINYLGMGTLKEMMLQISLVKTFPFKKVSVPEFDLTIFWEHSLGTAFLTEHIAKRFKKKESELYYLGGLLHDIGKLLIYHVHPDRFARIVQLQIESGKRDLEAEREVLGLDHSEIGAILAEKWHFASDVVAMIQNHHNPQPIRTLDVCLVRMANHLAKAAGLCFPWDMEEIPIVHDYAWEVLTQDRSGEIDVERMTFEIMDEAEKVKETVKTMLTRREGR